MSEDRNPDRERTFDFAYEGTPPWDIGRAQPAFVELADAGLIDGDVLGVDTAPRAIERARSKARDRGVDAEFVVHDATDLAMLDRQFDTIIDSGLFHVLAHEAPERYAPGLRSVLRPDGRLYVLGFDERDEGQGPGISPADVHGAFVDGWNVVSIEESAFETVGVEKHKRRAWLATLSPAERAG